MTHLSLKSFSCGKEAGDDEGEDVSLHLPQLPPTPKTGCLLMSIKKELSIRVKSQGRVYFSADNALPTKTFRSTYLKLLTG